MKLTIEQTLKQGISAHKKGNYKKAESFYRAVLKSQPKHPDANHNLGVLAVSLDKISMALPLFKNALDTNPNIEQFWLSFIDALIKEKHFENAKQILEKGRQHGVSIKLLNTLEIKLIEEIKKSVEQGRPSKKVLNNLIDYYEKGQYFEAEKMALSLTQEFPKHEFGWKVLGVLFGQSGRLSEALNANKKAVQLEPHNAEAHNNLGVTLQKLGKLEEAEVSYKKAISLKYDYAEAHNNLGYPLKGLGRLEEAKESIEKAITFRPNYPEAHSNLGVALKELGRLEESEVSLKRAIELKYKYAEAHNNLGVTFKERGRLKEAEKSYREAISIKPDFADAYLNLSDLLERLNKHDDGLLIIQNAKEKIFDRKSDFLLSEAIFLYRQKKYDFLSKLINEINLDELEDKRKPVYLNLKANWQHYLKDFNAAFETFKVMNKIIQETNLFKNQGSNEYFIEQKEKVSQLEILGAKFSNKIKYDVLGYQPTFLIGFPRSGTTLLDTILRGHSKIDVVEEKPMVSEMGRSLGYLSNISDIEKIEKLSVDIAINVYFEELKNHLELRKNSILIDKLPLNILNISLINKIFPRSKFILSLRHPLDCILSCWMQNFELNPAMANMCDLDRIVDFYCIAMKNLNLSLKRYQLNIHRIRYEDLVNDFEGEVSKTLVYLGLKWENQLKNHQKTASKRGIINTPSYSQVIEPIYKTSKFRWKNYEKHLEKYLNKLEPWLNEFGYVP